MEIILLIVFAILGFALYGFICFCTWLAKPSGDSWKQSEPTRPSTYLSPDEIADARGAERLLEHFYASNKIDADQYDRIRSLLELDYKNALQRTRATTIDEGVEVTYVADSIDAEPDQETAASEIDSIPVAQIAPDWSAPVHALDAEDEPENDPVSASPPVPQRSLAEMLAGFMEKRNIRWGELASGLLIVGSAVGLVISLREELRDRIPYFSALVFMLITAAIHGAGAYTLKRWKLRNTSRGVLLIGMLLIPLNFLAACLLNGSPEQRRSLTDPLFWFAVIAGTVGYSAMSWFSTRNLFRIRHLGIAVCVVACGVTILVVNRLDGFSNSIVSIWLLTFVCFITWHISLLISAPQILKRSYASVRFRDRLLTTAGIGLFSLIAVVAMLLIRSENRLQTLLTLTPWIGSVGIAVICIGDRLSGNQQVDDAIAEVADNTRLVGRSLNFAGWGILLVSMLGSLFHPWVAFMAGAIVILLSVAIRVQRRVSGLATVAWIAFSLTVLMTATVATQRIAIGSWASLPELVDAFSHSQSGIALMVTGAFALLAEMFWKRQTGNVEVIANSSVAHLFPEPLRQFSVAKIFAGAAAVVGVAWLVLASVLHRADWWDVNLGTVVLLAFAVGGLVLNACYQQSRLIKIGIVAAVLLAGSHLLYWNPWWGEFFVEDSPVRKLATGFDVRFISLTAWSALVVTISHYVERRRLAVSEGDPFRISGWLLMSLALITALVVSPWQSTWTIICILAVGVANGLLIASRRYQKDGKFSLPLMQVLQALVLVGIVANVTIRSGVAESLNSSNHVMLQVCVLSIVMAFTDRFRNFFGWGQWKWLLRFVAIVFFSWFVVSMANLCLGELVAGYDGDYAATWLNLDRSIWPLILTAAVVFFGQLLIADPETEMPDGIIGCLALVAMTSAAAVTVADAQAVATVCRWLVPMGVSIAAILIGVRQLLPDRTRSLLLINANRNAQQTIINILLTVAVIVVLGISTVAIARFLLIGGEALGGPIAGTWFGNLRKDVSYGGPVGLIVGTFLWFAITERRSFLAMAGSGVFQYVVLLSIVLLFLSPHPKLASSWFINIMQAISLGMSGYGLVWLWQRSRIGEGKVDFGMTEFLSRWKMLDAHAIINALLVLSMVVLIFQRYFFYPTVSGDWIAAAGSPLGVATAIMVSLFAVLLWRAHLRTIVDLILMSGCLATVAYLAAAVDRFQSNGSGFIPWSSYRTLACGSLLTVGLLLAKTLLQVSSDPAARLKLRTSLPEDQSRYSRIAIGIAIGVSFLFCIFGVDADVGGSWVYLIGSGLLIFAMACHAYFFCSSFVGFAVLPMVWVFAGQLTLQLGLRFNAGVGASAIDVFLSQVGATGIVAAMWIAIDWISIRLKRAPMGRRFFWMPNVVTLFTNILVLGMTTIALTVATESVAPSMEPSGFHLFAILGAGVAWLATFWSRRGRFRLFAGLLNVVSMLTLAMCVLPGAIVNDGSMRAALGILAWALTFFLAANVWARFDKVKRLATRCHVVALDTVEGLLRKRLPGWIFGIGLFVFFLATLFVWHDDWRAARVTASMAALTLKQAFVDCTL